MQSITFAKVDYGRLFSVCFSTSINFSKMSTSQIRPTAMIFSILLDYYFSFTNVAIKELVGSMAHQVHLGIWIAFKHRAENLTLQRLLPAFS